jgi:hypothetical protein
MAEDIFGENTTVERTPKPQWIPLSDGEYFGHIVEVDTREVNTHKNTHRAKVYNCIFQVADENSTNNYEYPWGNTRYTTTGAEYVGKKIRARGVFRYLEPKDGDTFEAFQEGNATYKYFCDALSIPMINIEKKVGGEDVVVKALPTITNDDIIGKPVIAVVGDGKPYTNKNGKEVTPKEVKFVKYWKDGVQKEGGLDEDIPF